MGAGGKVLTDFDADHSGAVMAWRFGHLERPLARKESTRSRNLQRTLLYVEDRDLWHFNLPESQAVNAFLSSLPFAFGVWGAVAQEIEDDHSIAIECGKAILSLQAKQLDLLFDASTRMMTIAMRPSRLSFPRHGSLS